MLCLGFCRVYCARRGSDVQGVAGRYCARRGCDVQGVAGDIALGEGVI